MYLYNTTIYKDTTNVLGLDVTQNNLDKADFETNYKSSVYLISKISILETTVEIDKTYTQFKALIVNPILWSDVKMVEETNHYDLYLLSANPL